MRILLGLILVAQGALAARVECRAKVALNREYDVSLDTSTRHLDIKTDNEFHYQGTSAYYYSPQLKSTRYYLPSGFAGGHMVEIEEGGQQRVALCLKSNECYLCR